MNSSARTWIAITGTCPGEEEAFVEATMVQERQLQVFFIDIDISKDYTNQRCGVPLWICYIVLRRRVKWKSTQAW